MRAQVGRLVTDRIDEALALLVLGERLVQPVLRLILAGLQEERLRQRRPPVVDLEV